MNADVKSPDSDPVSTLTQLFEFLSENNAEWSERTRIFPSPVIVCDGFLTVLGANDAFFRWSGYDLVSFERKILQILG